MVGPAEIGVVVYPDVQLAAVHGLTDLFAIANRLSGARGGDDRPTLRVTHWQVDARDASVSCIYDSHPQRPRALPDIVLVPLTLVDVPGPDIAAPLAEWLKARHASGATVGSICSGVFILAETGLLAGRVASTHWTCAELLAARFPDINVSTELHVVDDGDVITAGGFMAWVDGGLRLVSRLLGAATADETARFLTVDGDAPERRYFNGFSPRLMHGDAAILRVQHWVHGRDPRGVSLAAMAAHAGLEKRTFLRRFLRATGVAPLEYCRNLRIARARELLEFSKKTQKVIAGEVGYDDPGAFARAFRKATGQSPADYRRLYGVYQAAPASREQRNALGP